jgi:hypothetical protein
MTITQCLMTITQALWRHKLITQRDLNRSFWGPEFPLAEKYGEHLGVLFTALTFSAGMPLMTFTALVSFAASYFLEKFYLLQVRTSTRPIHIKCVYT